MLGLWWKLALATAMTLLLACSGGSAPPSQRPTPALPSTQTASVPEPEMSDDESGPFRYDPTGKRDPFRSFIRLSGALGEGTIASPLERFDLSQLMVTAIIWGNDAPRALIQDPSGKEYIVATGTSIGKNQGKVVQIEDNLVLVKETYIDFRDRATTNEVEMRLYESHGG